MTGRSARGITRSTEQEKMIKWILNKIVGSKNQRELRRLRPVVKRILDKEKEWEEEDVEFLRKKTREWQAYLHRFKPLDMPPRGIIMAADAEALQGYAARLNKRFEALGDLFPKLPHVEALPESIEEGKKAFMDIEPKFDKLRAKYLETILPEAFAAVKLGARYGYGVEHGTF